MLHFLQRPLLSCASHFASKARLSLLTLMVLVGAAWGLWDARPASSTVGAATRSGAAVTLCKQASIAFQSNTSVQQMGQLLRAEDAYILYGPDEFGEYQLRFGSNVALNAAVTRLQQNAHVQTLIVNPDCTE